jgi:hypothetical protein
LKDKIGEKQLITKKESKIIKKVIKRIRVKIEIKNKLEGNHKFFIKGLN